MSALGKMKSWATLTWLSLTRKTTKKKIHHSVMRTGIDTMY